MFQEAYKLATKFTKPIIISYREVSGKCKSAIGAYVVINSDGWIVTCYHIIKLIEILKEKKTTYTNLVAERSAIENNDKLKNHEKINKIKKLKIDNSLITNFTIWYGENLSITEFKVIPQIDLAVGKLINFNQQSIDVYPKFKDPSKAIEPGKSLCKLGYPFHEITPTFDVERNRFILPLGSIPPPQFPIDGIFTRIIEFDGDRTNPEYIPLKQIETTSPGLKGQSGGPTFDNKGVVWAIQSKTNSLKLGFGENATGKEGDYMKNQYLNVGLGIHCETLTSFFRKNEIRFDISDY